MGRVLASSDDPDRHVKIALPKLKGARIESMEVTAPAWDMIVHLSRGLRLVLFSDHTSESPNSSANWYATVDGSRVEAGPGTLLIVKSTT